MSETPEDKPGQFGSNIFQNISGSSIQVHGNIDASLQAGGDIVGRDKITNITYHYPQAQPVDPQTLAAAQARLEELPLETVPEPAPLPPGSLMPFLANPLFVGREEELRQLARLLKQGQTAAVTGLGGIGKSQLATEFAHRYGQYFAGGVFWLSFAQGEAVSGEVARCGGLGGMQLQPDFESLDLPTQVTLVRRAWQEEIPRLLIFDNCEEEFLLDEWRPRSGGCRVLFTSRRARWSAGLGLAELRLEVLPREKSVALLQQYLRYNETVKVSETSAVLPDIAAELGDLPLALDLAGNFLNTYQQAVTPAAYLAQLRDKNLLDHPSLQGRGATLSPTGHERHVARTFSLSYERLDRGNEIDGLALALLERAAFFAPGESIPHALLLATIEVNEKDLDAALTLEDALQRLVGLGLLSTIKEDDLLLHRLLAHLVRPAVSDLVAAQAAVEEAILEAVNQRRDEADHLWDMLSLFGHLKFVTDAALNRINESAGLLTFWSGYYLKQIGDYSTARSYYEHALAILEQVLGSEHSSTASSLNNLAMLLYEQGDYEAAQPYVEQALTIREKLLGPEHSDTASSLNNLASLLQKQGDYKAARPYFERALAIYEKALGLEHPDTANGLNNLGLLLQDQGDYEAARSYCERALAIREKTLGSEHPDTANSLNNLASLLTAQGDYEAAQLYYKRALTIVEKALGPAHPNTQIVRDNLASLED